MVLALLFNKRMAKEPVRPAEVQVRFPKSLELWVTKSIVPSKTRSRNSDCAQFLDYLSLKSITT